MQLPISRRTEIPSFLFLRVTPFLIYSPGFLPDGTIMHVYGRWRFSTVIINSLVFVVLRPRKSEKHFFTPSNPPLAVLDFESRVGSYTLFACRSIRVELCYMRHAPSRVLCFSWSITRVRLRSLGSEGLHSKPYCTPPGRSTVVLCISPLCLFCFDPNFIISVVITSLCHRYVKLKYPN